MIRVGRVMNFRSKKLLILMVVLVSTLLYIKNLNSNENNSWTNSAEKAEKLLMNGDEPVGDLGNEVGGGGFDAEQSEMLVRLLKNSKHDFERQVERDIAKQVAGLGDNGKSAKLDGDSKEIGEKQLATIALNEELSEHISYNRTTPDTRHPLCKKKNYDIDALGTTSVVVIFYNEPYSVLVRTVHSVLNTSPARLLKEIILVDDGSTNEELKGKLDYYVNTRLPKKVKLLRLKNR